jgi:hypothetical protein
MKDPVTAHSPAKPITVSTLPKRSRRTTWVAIVVCVVVLASIWLVIRIRAIDEPRLNADTASIARFVHGSGFNALPFDKQRQFYKVLDDRGKELDEDFKTGRIPEIEYRSAIEGAWLGKHINQVEKYFSLPPGQERTNYIDQLVTKKLKPKDGKKVASDKDAIDIKADETAAEMRVESWPLAAREQWKQFHTAYRNEKKSREKASAGPSGT